MFTRPSTNPSHDDTPRSNQNKTHHNHKDAIVLDRCLDEAKDDLNKALPLYSKRRGPEARALVEFQVRSQNRFSFSII